MTQAATFDDVWRMFQEMIREDRERWVKLDLKTQETARTVQETSEQMKETDRKMQETDRKMQETDRKMQETDQQMKETDRMVKETTRTVKETSAYLNMVGQRVDQVTRNIDRLGERVDQVTKNIDRLGERVDQVTKNIDRLGGRLGEFVEGLVAPACRTLFAQRGIPVHKVSRRVEADLPGGRHMEIDLFVVNTDSVSLVEVKSKLTVDDVRDHLEHMSEFKEFFPEHADKKVFGAVAGMVVEDNVIRFAISKGLFVLVQAGDSVRLANDEGFVPRTW
ncbi:MAG: hypothetical protein H7839_01575 [Magnetococcus sp. YQC-5]